MDLEKIEEIYRKDLETSEQEFSDGVKKNLDLKVIEADYIKKVELARKKYYSSMAEFIKQEKILISKKKKKKKTEEKLEELNVKPGKFELSFWERLKLNWSHGSFKFKFQIRNFRRSHTPYFLSYGYLKAKIKTKRILFVLNEFLASLSDAFKNNFILVFNKIKESSITVYKTLGTLPGKIFLLFKKIKHSKKKKEESTEEKENVQEKKSPEPNLDQNK
jgi:hypothetical protein